MLTVAGSITRFLPFFKKRKAYKVLDYGAGNLRNASFLAQEGFNVYAADLPEQLRRVRNGAGTNRLLGLVEVGKLNQTNLNVDVVISTFVFTIIPDPAERKRYLDNIVMNLRPGGYLLIETRCRELLKSVECDNAAQHRCLFCAGSYSRGELDQIMAGYGFKQLGHYYGRHSLGILYRMRSANAAAAD